MINGKQVISIIRVCGQCYLAGKEGPAPSLVVLIPELIRDTIIIMQLLELQVNIIDVNTPIQKGSTCTVDSFPGYNLFHEMLHNGYYAH